MFLPFSITGLRLTQFPFITWGLVFLNLLIFVHFQALPPTSRQVIVFEYGFMPCRASQLLSHEPVVIPVSKQLTDGQGNFLNASFKVSLPYEPKTIILSWVSYSFLHGTWLHLIGNLWFLWLFGRYIENCLGHSVFLIFYLGGGVLAAAAHWSVMSGSTQPVIGASGAVAAILGAFAVLYPYVRVQTLVFIIIYFTDIELPALILLTLWFIGQVISGLFVSPAADYTPAVAWWAHVGGFVAGMWLIMFFTPRRQLKENTL
ncbi:MAG: rhomboid family intramembrane serine protease [Planctomycetia bacterium]|nr:rhomboid family intramembrane serine protease [Planctomycetia bacterium]